MLSPPRISILGSDPNRTHRINANSYQQHALITVNGFQYVAFYTSPNPSKPSTCYVNLARRRIDPIAAPQEWETLIFNDYEQTVDDGHNTISIGVCRGDGTVHVAFDHHCDILRFRISKLGVAGKEGGRWVEKCFGDTQDFLPGVPRNALMEEVTYPRFVNVGDDLMLTWRIGQAGLGSDILFHYSSTTHTYTYLGQHLTGVSNSPYMNGIDFRLHRLHISWCYRNFIPIPPSSNAHKQQAGPNGPENNHDLNYAYSDDLGRTWLSSTGEVLAKLESGEGENSKEGMRSILPPSPGTEGARVFEIPMASGILNQEAQCADWEGGFWVLNREKRGGEEKWIVYRRNAEGRWTATEVEAVSTPTETGNRASICVNKRNEIFLILPGNMDSSLSILRVKKMEREVTFETIWRGENFDGEPCVDVGRLEDSDVLSVFTRTDRSDGKRDVVVLDFDLGTEDERASKLIESF